MSKYLIMLVMCSSLLVACTKDRTVGVFREDDPTVEESSTEASIEESTEVSTEESSTEEYTHYIHESQELETNEVFVETYSNSEDVYTETVAYASRYPEYDLPDIEGFEKDAYGNYIISKQMFEDEILPVNDDGLIEYIEYYDENGILVNPMPLYYFLYLGYFVLNGG